MSEYPEAAARFARETDGHEMTVLHEADGYRHLRFENPQYGAIYRFDLVTWPHGLLIRGDGPNFVFSLYPTVDLFEMFRRTAARGDINVGYWEEKVVAGQVKSWSGEMFQTWLTLETAKNESRYPGLMKAVRRQILNSDEHSLEYRGSAEYAVASFTHLDYRLRFPDRWEESFEDYSWEFLWACHAIRWGIAQYDAAMAKQAVAS
ncbi:hypothetical protein [Streptomyces sp. NPDC048272]|uniref:hypothetical protein n=1 Tax=Streptomyces sp. NPDC048272 TaxID=3154616 RepID=UPI00342389F2